MACSYRSATFSCLAGVGCWVENATPLDAGDRCVRVVCPCHGGAISAAGGSVTHERVETIADGIGVRIPVAEALDDIRSVTDEIVLVTDAQILDAMRLLPTSTWVRL